MSERTDENQAETAKEKNDTHTFLSPTLLSVHLISGRRVSRSGSRDANINTCQSKLPHVHDLYRALRVGQVGELRFFDRIDVVCCWLCGSWCQRDTCIFPGGVLRRNLVL